jgi:hypothetical protein
MPVASKTQQPTTSVYFVGHKCLRNPIIENIHGSLGNPAATTTPSSLPARAPNQIDKLSGKEQAKKKTNSLFQNLLALDSCLCAACLKFGKNHYTTRVLQT